MATFIDRVGLALVAPGRAFALAERQEAGVNDASLLLVFKLVATQARSLVAVVWTALAVGIGPAATGLGNRVVAAIGFDMLLILGGGLLVTILAGRHRAPTRDFDLAAVAWVPYLAVNVTASLLLSVFGVGAPKWAAEGVTLLGLAWTAVWLFGAVRFARRRHG